MLFVIICHEFDCGRIHRFTCSRYLFTSTEIDLGDGLPEELALGSGDLFLKCGRLTGTGSTSEGAGTPR